MVYADAISKAWKSQVFDKFINKYIVFNDYFKEQLERENISPDNIVILPNFVHVPYEKISNKMPYAVYLGRLSSEKGIDNLLNAWADIDGMILKVAGSGPLRDKLIERSNSDLRGKVEYLGFVEGEDKQTLLRKASLFVLPSEWPENCPISLLESLAAGTPVLVSRVGGMPSMVKHDKTGFLINPKDKDSLVQYITLCVDDPSMVVEKSQNALLDAISRFSPAVHYKGLIEIYNQVIDDKGNSKSSN
jgi:glycosyltransferase involved in cell wall biosynthesis